MLNLILEETIKITIDYTQKMRKEFKHFIIKKKKFEAKGKGEKERYTHLNAEFQKQKGEVRKPFSAINANKQKKTIEQERLEIFSRKLEIPREYFIQRLHTKGQKQQGPNRNRRD